MDNTNDLMMRGSDCGTLKTKTDFYFRNNNQILGKECAQCLKIKQIVYNSEKKRKNYKKQYFQLNKEKINEYKKQYIKNRIKTDVNYRLIVYNRNRL